MLLQIRAKLRHFSSSSCANSMAQSCHPSPAHPAALFPLPARRFLLLIAARSCCIFYAISYFIWMCFFLFFFIIFMLFRDPSTFASHSHPHTSLSYCLLGNVLSDFIFLVLVNASSFCVRCIHYWESTIYLRDGQAQNFIIIR